MKNKKQHIQLIKAIPFYSRIKSYSNFYRILLGIISGVLLPFSGITQCDQFRMISLGDWHSMGIKSDGTLWVWGNNSRGELGDGTTINKNSPVQILPGTSWRLASAGGSHSLAIKSDSTLWAWGNNYSGQVGYNSNDDVFTTPVQIAIGTKWLVISAGSDHSLAIKSDGTLWSWGSNYGGELGNGSHIGQAGPIQVGTANDWQNASICAGALCSMAVKNGMLWVWGGNYYGKLGDAATVNQDITTPKFISAGWRLVNTSIKSSHSVGIKTDGTLWAWGQNQYGQLGDGTIGARAGKLVPTQIGTDNDWKNVDVGGDHTTALKNNGTIWSWGLNSYGLFGSGTNNNQSSIPIISGTYSDWKQIDVGGSHIIGQRIDNSVWSWGRNDYGPLGDGTFISRFTPKQISAGGGYNSLATYNLSASKSLSAGNNHISQNCGLIAGVTPNGDNPISGSITAQVWIENSHPVNFVKRHYQIAPDLNTTTATGRVTLYFTQQDFDDFNSIPSNTLKLPASSSDTRKANLRVEKRGGASTDNTGLPDTYPGTVETIDPVDTDIVWNSALNVWEVSFDVTGFSGFFVKTQEAALPVSFGNISAILKNGHLVVNWQTLSETNNSHFEIQVSQDGRTFKTIKSIQSKAIDGNSNDRIHYEYNAPLTTLAQLGIAAAVCMFCIGYSRRRLVWIPLLFITLCATLFIACNKTSTDASVNENERLFVRIVQVDKDGGSTFSNAIKVQVK